LKTSVKFLTISSQTESMTTNPAALQICKRPTMSQP